MGTAVLLSFICIWRVCDCASSNSMQSLSAVIPDGDIILGGLFPVHTKSTSGTGACGTIQPERGIQRLEAMLYTIDMINNDPNLLPDVKLGANILDTCSRDTYALDQALEYVIGSLTSLQDDYKCRDGSKPRQRQASEGAVAGVIGGSYSTVSIQVANLLRLFHIPQISYASTSAVLSDKTRFDYFARTVPPDNLQAKAMADIVQYFNWTYVSTVASDGDYGENGIEAFKFEAKRHNICMAVTAKIPPSATKQDFNDIIIDLKAKSAVVVVLFLRVEDARNLLLTAKRLNVKHFIWVASDGWGTQQVPVEQSAGIAEGALTIELNSPILSGFDDYFKALNPLDNSRNPWFMEYWESIHECIFEQNAYNATNSTVFCIGNETTQMTQESKIHFVSDAVYAMATALHNYIQDTCTGGSKSRRKCARTKRIDREILFKNYLLNKSFESKNFNLELIFTYDTLIVHKTTLPHWSTVPETFVDEPLMVLNSGQNKHVISFNNKGDGAGRYNILNFQENPDTKQYTYVKVGT